jgi:hypothetical protein
MSIQRERENTQHELERTQRELGEAYQMKAELELTREESFTLKSQLDDEEQNRLGIRKAHFFLFVRVLNECFFTISIPGLCIV